MRVGEGKTMTTTLYRHTQAGTLMRAILGAVALIAFGALVFFSLRFNPVGLGMSSVMLVVFSVSLLLFHSLTVTVSDEALELRFGVGLIRKSYAMSDVVSCNIVKNSVIQGWGIHWCGKDGWVYNVSGFDAVEVVMKDGRKARIGTDMPRELAAAINERLAACKGKAERR